MTLERKVAGAKELIQLAIDHFKSPVVMSSFGKDSMVVLALLKQMGYKFPVLFHREAFCPSKYSFANRVIEQEQYAVYDYPPSMMKVAKRGDSLEIVNFFQTAEGGSLYLPIGIKEPLEGQPFLCGFYDFYKKPLGSFAFPWDLAFIGHKSSDVCPILGHVPLSVDIKTQVGCSYAFPLRHFTDEDIWSFIEKYEVPYNERRYDKSKSYAEIEDDTFNNDYFRTCTNCIDRDQPISVWCPKLKCEIANRASQISYFDDKASIAYVRGDQHAATKSA